MQPSAPGSDRPLRVLVVDPDERTRESLGRLLGIANRCLVVGDAGDVEPALELAASLRPDVVVLDLRLPDVDGGLRFVRRLRELVPDVRVLVMSPTDSGDEEGRVDADGYVRKTFRAQELADAVRAAGRADAARSADGEASPRGTLHW